MTRKFSAAMVPAACAQVDYNATDADNSAGAAAENTKIPTLGLQSSLLWIWDPVLEFVPVFSDDPVFNCAWLMAYGFWVVTLRQVLNQMNQMHGKSEKKQKIA